MSNGYPIITCKAPEIDELNNDIVVGIILFDSSIDYFLYTMELHVNCFLHICSLFSISYIVLWFLRYMQLLLISLFNEKQSIHGANIGTRYLKLLGM